MVIYAGLWANGGFNTCAGNNDSRNDLDTDIYNIYIPLPSGYSWYIPQASENSRFLLHRGNPLRAIPPNRRTQISVNSKCHNWFLYMVCTDGFSPFISSNKPFKK